MKHGRKPTTAEGELMYQLRIAADLTQQEVCEPMGLHFTQWSRIESGARARATVAQIHAFCDVVGVDDATRQELLDLRSQPDPRFPRLAKKLQAALDEEEVMSP